MDNRKLTSTDGWQDRRTSVTRSSTQSTSPDERGNGGRLNAEFKFEMPMLLDNMENEVDLKYAALKERAPIPAVYRGRPDLPVERDVGPTIMVGEGVSGRLGLDIGRVRDRA